MITKKEFSTKIVKSKIKKIENILRQIAEEKPYLLAEFKEKRFFDEAKKIIGDEKIFDFIYAKNWLSGYRRKGKKSFQ